jgi:hypothetical protein
MKCEDIKTLYLKSMGDSIDVDPAKTGGCIIHTLHLDPSSEPIDLLINEVDDKFRISDITHSMEYLFLHGVDIKPDSRQKWFMDFNIKRLGVNFSEDELYIEVSKNDLAVGISKIIDAMNAISDLIYTMRIRGASDFKKEVSDWLTDNGINYTSDKAINGVTREPTIDFVINRKGNIPVFLYALHSRSYSYAKVLTDSITMDFIDLEKANHKFVSTCLLDDTNDKDVWKNQYTPLTFYLNKVEYWSERDNLLPLLI